MSHVVNFELDLPGDLDGLAFRMGWTPGCESCSTVRIGASR